MGGGVLRSTRRPLHLALLTLTILLLACGGDTAPRTASPTANVRELACEAEVRESVTLANDLHCEGVALAIVADGVTLDLGGHVIAGGGPGRRSWPLPDFDVAGIVVRAANATVRNGVVRATGIGVLVDGDAGGHAATLSGLQTLGNYYGIYVYRADGNRIEDNTVRDNVYGLHLQGSNGNQVTGNDLSAQTHHSPGGYGLYLYQANDNRIERNTIADNLNWGLWFSDSTRNLVVRNDVIANDPQVSDDTGGNLFHDEAAREGNYWSDYTGPDGDGDGIGDLPYTVGGPGRAIDPYPFVSQSGWVDRTTTTTERPTVPPAPALPPRGYLALADGSVAALDPVSGALLGIWPVGVTGVSLAVSPDGTRLYAIAGDEVVALETTSGAVIARWPAPGARVLAATYDGTRVLVSSDDRLTEIVLASGELREQHAGAGAVALTPSWKHNLAFATLADGTVRVVYLPDQHSPWGVELPGAPAQALDNRAGTRLFVLLRDSAEVLILDTEQFTVTDRVPLPDVRPGTTRVASSPDGTLLYVLDRAGSRLLALDLGTKQLIAEVTLRAELVDLAVSGDGASVLVATAGGLTIYDRDLRPLRVVALPSEPLTVVVTR